MKNEGLKQANILANWLETNNRTIDDLIVTIVVKDSSTYKIMSDGSIVAMSAGTDDDIAFQNANVLITSIESKKAKPKDSVYKITVKTKGE